MGGTDIKPKQKDKGQTQKAKILAQLREDPILGPVPVSGSETSLVSGPMSDPGILPVSAMQLAM